MKRISLMFVLAGLMLGLLYSLALACDTCGCQDQAAAAATAVNCADCAKAEGGVCGHCALAKAKDEQVVQTVTELEQCPMCVEAGGLCEHCAVYAREVLSKLAADMCPDCEADALCAKCQAAVEAALAAYPSLEAKVVTQGPVVVAYLEGKANGEEELFGRLMEETGKQNLFGPETMFGTIYPDVMVKGYTPDSTVYAFVMIPEGTTVQAPLQLFTAPGGTYLNVTHHGSYNELGVSWMDALAYADLHGLTPGTGVAGQVYVSNPTVTPEDQLVTEIYIPLVVAEVAQEEPHRPSA